MVQCEWKHVGRRFWLMLAGDEVYANRTSLVGSIGVINATFGAVEAIKRLGLERRVYTAGKYKDLLDPFRCAHRCHCWPPSCLSVSRSVLPQCPSVQTPLLVNTGNCTYNMCCETFSKITWPCSKVGMHGLPLPLNSWL